MQKVRVLSIRHDESNNYRTSALRGHVTLIESLKKFVDVKEIWVVEEGGSTLDRYSDEVSVYNVFAFKNAIELLDNLRPDVVIIYAGDYEYLSRSLLKAASHRRVPTVDIRLSSLLSLDENGFGSKTIGRFHALSKRGPIIIKKYLFLLRTLNRIGFSLNSTVKDVIKDLYLPFAYWSPMYKFGGADLNIVSTQEWLNLSHSNGIPRKKVVLTGDISMDGIYKDLSRLKKENVKRIDKTEILFITDSMVEHGYWTPLMRDRLVTSVVLSMKEEPKVILRVKIHPTSETLSTYTNLLAPIDPELEIIQNADLLPLINESDIIITFGLSSAILQAILLDKPVYLLNFYQNKDIPKNPFLRENMVFECNSATELMDNLNNRIDQDQNRYRSLERFIDKYIYKFDGKCSERVAERIMSLINDFYKNSLTPEVHDNS